MATNENTSSSSATTNFLNSTPRHQQLQSQTARRNSARRHTTPDMAASAAYGMGKRILCGSDEMEQRYRGRIEKVKFGVPVNEAFCPDIPATLLVLLLKVYKEGPLKKDIWRAPGNQAQVRKLSHIMQHGRLVNISNISVYTAASVIKRFLAKLPGGIFGVDNERQLFELAEQQNNMADDQQIIGLFCRIVTALTVPSQHLLVLLFGTFRVITDSAQSFGTRMTPDAIGISVAPSLFHTCIHDGQRAKLEDIMRFKLASQVITKIIQAFGLLRLFPFECYEFYARITGKTLRRDENCWHISFHLPSRTLSQPAIRFERRASSRRESSSFELEQQSPSTSKQQQDGEEYDEDVHGTAPPSAEEFCCEDEDVYGESLPELGRHVPPPSQHYRRREQSRSLEESKIEWKYRASASGGAGTARRRREEGLSTSMGEVVVHSEEEEEGPDSFLHSSGFLLESTRSLTYLEWVHERQTRRMKTRSEWFLSPPSSSASPCSAAVVPSMRSSAGGNGGNKKSGGCCSRSAELLLTRSGTAAEHRSHGKQQQQQQCHHHLQLPSKEEEAMVSSSGEEEVCMSSEAGCCSRSGCAGPSTDTSMKCSPQRPGSSVLSCCTSGSMGGGDAQMKSQTTTEASSVDGDDHDRDHDHDHDHDDDDDDAFLSVGQCSSSPTKVLRQPFQLLQERQYSTSTTEGSGPSAQVTPSATTGADVLLYGSGAKNSGGAGCRQRFFGSGEQEGGLQALPELVETTSSSPQARRYSAPFVTAATMQPQAQQPQQQSIEPSTAVSASAAAIMSSARPVVAASMSSGSSSGGGSSSGTSTQTVVAAAVVGGGSATTGEGGGAVVQQQQQQQQGARGVSSGGVVRRRSWRVHYTRPKNKSFEYETSTGSAYEEVAPFLHSTPLCQSQPGSLIFARRRRSSNGGGGGGTGVDLDMAAAAVPPSSASSIGVASAATTSTRTAAGTVLVRRRSSNNGGDGGTNAKAKMPVQSRRSTQI